MNISMRSLLCAALMVLPLMASQAQRSAPREPLKLSVDCARFRGPDDSTAEVELYYGFPQSSLVYLPDSGGYRGTLDITVTVKNRDSLVYGSRWLAPHIVPDTSSLVQGMTLVSVHNLSLPAGDYILKVFARDVADPSRKDSVLLRLPVRPVGSGKTMLSDLELASTVRFTKDKTPFYKNSFEVKPNVGGLFSEDQPCYYYAEAYNLLQPNDASQYAVHSAVFDAVGKEILSWDRVQKRKFESRVLVDTVSIRNLKTGTYTLLVSLVDSAKATLASAGKKFFVYNSKLGVDSSLVASGSSLPLAAYAGMSEAELDEEFKEARYEATSDEKSMFDHLKGAESKRKFLSAFWRKRPAGAREEYFSRVAFANSNFQLMGRKGYRTDRGRVYITYGPPDDFDRHPNEPESRPYEVWTYNSIQGGVIFVFIMRNSGGDYELVHSTHRNELHDDNWQQYLSIQ